MKLSIHQTTTRKMKMKQVRIILVNSSEFKLSRDENRKIEPICLQYNTELQASYTVLKLMDKNTMFDMSINMSFVSKYKVHIRIEHSLFALI
jgi:hypothetical protein